MSKIFENVKGKLYHLQGASLEDVIAAENKLGISFCDEFRNYLMDYGAASFGSHEFLGLCCDDYLNVVSETLREREKTSFPKYCYLIENLGIDGILILQDENGNIYELNDAGLKKIFGSFKEYVDSLQ